MESITESQYTVRLCTKYTHIDTYAYVIWKFKLITLLTVFKIVLAKKKILKFKYQWCVI